MENTRKVDPVQTIKYLTQDELTRLLAVVTSRRDRAIFLVAYYHGLRLREAADLKMDDIDLDRGRIWITRLKGSLSGEHPLQEAEIKALKSWLWERNHGVKSHPSCNNNPYLFPSQQKRPLSGRMIDYLMKLYGEQANIPENKRHFHVFKHSIATHMLEAGVDVSFVKEWLGHRDINSTMVYAQITNRSRDEKARQLFATNVIVNPYGGGQDCTAIPALCFR